MVAAPACAGSMTGAAPEVAPTLLAAGVEVPRDPTPSPTPEPPRTLSLAEARRYLVTLVNRDRATMGLPPVELDDEAPTRAAQRHAEDMAKHGFLGHWGTDGSVPEQRLTEAGGADMVLENALCFTDEKRRALDPHPRIAVKDIERTESMFFDEEPPEDGHRRNILTPQHTKIGVGIALPLARPGEIPVPCVTQELVGAYGTYASLPRKAKLGDRVRVEGALDEEAKIVGVGVARAPVPRRLSVADANRRRSYPVPAPYEMFWPRGFKSASPLEIVENGFHVDVPLSDHGRPGLYEITVWAKVPGAEGNVIVGLRTIDVER